tara:strand:- start:426 stop:569 length:144 start_codon:yes stop_codon:yes gene_type:complete
MKHNKPFIFWFCLIVAWNFGFPKASPTFDVLVAVVLYYLTKIFKKNK